MQLATARLQGNSRSWCIYIQIFWISTCHVEIRIWSDPGFGDGISLIIMIICDIASGKARLPRHACDPHKQICNKQGTYSHHMFLILIQLGLETTSQASWAPDIKGSATCPVLIIPLFASSVFDIFPPIIRNVTRFRCLFYSYCSTLLCANTKCSFSFFTFPTSSGWFLFSIGDFYRGCGVRLPATRLCWVYWTLTVASRSTSMDAITLVKL